MPVSGWQQGKVRVDVIDGDTWAVVLTGAGERVFSAGMDLDAVRAGESGR